MTNSSMERVRPLKTLHFLLQESRRRFWMLSRGETREMSASVRAVNPGLGENLRLPSAISRLAPRFRPLVAGDDQK